MGLIQPTEILKSNNGTQWGVIRGGQCEGRTFMRSDNVFSLVSAIMDSQNHNNSIEYMNEKGWVGRDIGQGSGGQSGRKALRLLETANEVTGALWNPEQADIDLIQAMVEEFDTSMQSFKADEADFMRMGWRENSGRVHAGRLLAGSERYRRKRIRKKKKDGRAVRIVVDIGQNSDVDKAKGFMRAAAGMACAKFLESRNVSVELWAYEGAGGLFQDHGDNGQNKDHSSIWCVKDSKTRINMTTVASAMSTWFFRTFIFQSFHSQVADGRKPTSSLGRSLAPEKEEIATILGSEKSYILSASLTGSAEQCKESAMQAGRMIIEEAMQETFAGMGSNRWNNTDMYCDLD